MNCLAFWKSLQEYNAYFFADALNPSLLSRKARVCSPFSSGPSYTKLFPLTVYATNWRRSSNRTIQKHALVSPGRLYSVSIL